MTIVPRLAIGLVALLIAAILPAAAPAAEKTGRGENIKPIKNISYPDLNNPSGSKQLNAGTDLEFATITVAGPATPPGVPGPPAVTPPAGVPAPAPVAATPRAVAKSSKRAAAAKRAAARAAKRCSSARKAAKKAKSRRAKRSAQRRAKRLCAAATRAKKRAAKLRTSTAIARAGLRDARPETPGIQRTFAFAGSYGDGLHVIDVTDPENAERVATWNCGVSQADVQVFQRPDLGGRWFVTLTMDDSYVWYKDATCSKDLLAKGFKLGDHAGKGIFIGEVTNPYEPTAVSWIGLNSQRSVPGVASAGAGSASHNNTVHPSGQWMYNSNSDLITSPTPAVEVIDIRNIEQPKLAKEVSLKVFPGLGTESHDIDFSDDGKRAYVAALSHAEIFDTTNPGEPKSIGTVVDPVINVWHQTDEITVKDPVLGQRKFMIAEDEFAGASDTGQCPNGGVHVYDITGPLEQAPVKVGAWNITDTGPTEDNKPPSLGRCTAHVFQLHEKAQLMTIAYYNGGVRVVDLTGLVGVALGKQGLGGMREVGWYRFKDSDTWAVKTYQADRKGFYMFGNDQSRGFDVYKWTPAGSPSNLAPTNLGGVWRTPEQTLEAMKAYKDSGGKVGLGALCLINLGARAEEAAADAGMVIPR